MATLCAMRIDRAVAETPTATGASANGDLIACEDVDRASGETAIFVLSTEDTEVVQLTFGKDGPAKHPDWAPAGDAIVYVDDRARAIRIVSLTGVLQAGAPGCADDCAFLDYPAFSPDGTRIAYTAFQADSSGMPASSAIRVLNLASGEITELASFAVPNLIDIPRWSPDGRSLVVTIDEFDSEFRETGSAIAILSAEGGEPALITGFDQFAYYADWNRMTGEIVFGQESILFSADPSLYGSTSNLFVCSADGSGLRQLTDMPAGDLMIQPSWTPDGTTIVATRDEAATGRAIVFVDPVTGAIEPLPNGATRSYGRVQPILR